MFLPMAVNIKQGYRK